MNPIGRATAKSCSHGILRFCINWARYFGHHFDPDFCVKGKRDAPTQGNLVTHDVRIVVHNFSWRIRIRSAVDIFYHFQSFYCKLVRGASEEQYLTFSKFRLSMYTASRVDVAIHK